jgi:hypothetical protein
MYKLINCEYRYIAAMGHLQRSFYNQLCAEKIMTYLFRDAMFGNIDLLLNKNR